MALRLRAWLSARTTSSCLRVRADRLTASVPPASHHCAPLRQASCSTQQSTAEIRELSSAIGMNSSGCIVPNPGRSQRTRASTPITRSSANETIGWYRTRSSWWVIARANALRTENFVFTASCMELSKTAARALPLSFASYMARCACPFSVADAIFARIYKYNVGHNFHIGQRYRGHFLRLEELAVRPFLSDVRPCPKTQPPQHDSGLDSPFLISTPPRPSLQ